MPQDRTYVSRAGLKLAHALDTWAIHPDGWNCADFGSHAGGFVDCLLRAGAARVYAVERGYGVLDARLRGDPRVIVMERTDARGVFLPQPVRLITIDTGWTQQKHILPAAAGALAGDGEVITLIKPHYEADASMLNKGLLREEHLERVLGSTRSTIRDLGWQILAETESPLRGHGGNREFLWRLERPAAESVDESARDPA